MACSTASISACSAVICPRRATDHWVRPEQRQRRPSPSRGPWRATHLLLVLLAHVLRNLGGVLRHGRLLLELLLALPRLVELLLELADLLVHVHQALDQQEDVARLVHRGDDAARRHLRAKRRAGELLEAAERLDALRLRQQQVAALGPLHAGVHCRREPRGVRGDPAAERQRCPLHHAWILPRRRTGCLLLGLQVDGAQRADGLDGVEDKVELFLGLGVGPALRLRAGNSRKILKPVNARPRTCARHRGRARTASGYRATEIDGALSDGRRGRRCQSSSDTNGMNGCSRRRPDSTHVYLRWRAACATGVRHVRQLLALLPFFFAARQAGHAQDVPSLGLARLVGALHDRLDDFLPRSRPTRSPGPPGSGVSRTPVHRSAAGSRHRPGTRRRARTAKSCRWPW